MYIGACVGATCYEAQVGRIHCRVLRPKLYFWPYRHWITRRIVWPRAISFRLVEK